MRREKVLGMIRYNYPLWKVRTPVNLVVEKGEYQVHSLDGVYGTPRTNVEQREQSQAITDATSTTG